MMREFRIVDFIYKTKIYGQESITVSMDGKTT